MPALIATPYTLISRRSAMTMQLERPDKVLVGTFARTADPEALSELVRRHWADAFRLAYRVTGEASAAEDAAQEAFVALVRHAGSFDEERPFRPWFQALVLNAARMSTRSDRRRRGHEEEKARREPEATASNEGERRVAAEELDRKLLALPFELRTPLVLHYFEGCSHDEVAAALRCPKTTARSRIRRGLEQLRTTLAATAPLTLVEVERLLRAPGATPPAPPAPAIGTLLAAGKKAGLAAFLTKALASTLVLGLATTAVALERKAAAPLAAAKPAAAQNAPAKEKPENTNDTPETPPDAPLPRQFFEVGDGTPAAAPALTGRVVKNGAALAGATVRVLENGVSLAQTTGADGTFRFAGLKAGDYKVRAASDGLAAVDAKVTVDATGSGACGDLTLGDGATLTGRILDDTGAPVPGSVALVFRELSCLGEAHTGADGSFELRGLAAGGYLVAGFAKAPGTLADLLGSPMKKEIFRDAAITKVGIEDHGTATARNLVIARETARVRGLVTGPDGHAAANASVILVGKPAGKRVATTDSMGRFEIASLRAGPCTVLARLDDLVAPPVTVTVAVDATADVTLALAPGGAITGTVQGSAGEAEAIAVPLDPQGVDAHADVTDGKFRLGGLVPGRYRVSIATGKKTQGPSQDVVVIAEKETAVAFDVTPGTATVSVHVDGATAGMWARLYRGSFADPAHLEWITSRDGKGTVSLEQVRAGTYGLAVTLAPTKTKSTTKGIFLYQEGIVVADGATVDVTIPVPDDATRGGITGTVSTKTKGVVIAIGGSAVGLAGVAEDGTFTLDGLPAGTYRLGTCQGDDPSSARLDAQPVQVDAGSTTSGVAVGAR
jgi:RNA polymerase sigma-70 factor (ECF subfamily)